MKESVKRLLRILARSSHSSNLSDREKIRLGCILSKENPEQVEAHFCQMQQEGEKYAVGE